jgi:hypothetical protein
MKRVACAMPNADVVWLVLHCMVVATGLGASRRRCSWRLSSLTD